MNTFSSFVLTNKCARQRMILRGSNPLLFFRQKSVAERQDQLRKEWSEGSGGKQQPTNEARIDPSRHGGEGGEDAQKRAVGCWE